MLNCRFCRTSLHHTLVDLGTSPIANQLVEPESLTKEESFFPLKVYVCPHCLLVQIPAALAPQRFFNDAYTYFSSFSDSWLDHARRYADDMQRRFGLGTGSYVVEVASNDGYLLQFFQAAGVPVLGIEPAGNCAAAARAKGIPTEVRFFGKAVAAELADRQRADLMIANNVLAHVPDINDFVAGFQALLKPDGVATFEFPHVLNLIAQNEFDTIYHEHYSYLSLYAVEQILAAHGLEVFDVEEWPSHGGSLRLFVQHRGGERACENAVAAVRAKEREAHLHRLEGFTGFAARVQQVKRELLKFLIAAKEEGRTVVGYGAPAKGNTLLNYCGVRTDLLAYTVDRSPHKQGRYLPGTRIPVHAPERILETKPDFVLILPWNLKDEIMEQMQSVRTWGGRFVTPIPALTVH